MERVSDDLGTMVRKAINDLPVLEAARDLIRWEVFPFLGMVRGASVPGVHYMIGIGVRVALTGDHVINYDPVSDPYEGEEVTRVVKALYQAAEKEAAEVTAAAMRESNGHGTPGSGLILP